MQKLIKSFYKSSMVTSISLFVVGVLLLFKSSDTIMFISYMLGGVLLVLGLVAIINFFRTSSMNPFNDLNIVYGVVTIILGVLVVSHPTAIATFIPFVVGLGILINSSIKLAYSIELRNNGDEIWKSTLILSSISALCGILILFNPFRTSVLVFKVIGIFIIIYSLMDVLSMYKIKKNFNVFSDNLISEDDSAIEAEIVSERDDVDDNNAKEDNFKTKKSNKKKNHKKDKSDKEKK